MEKGFGIDPRARRHDRHRRLRYRALLAWVPVEVADRHAEDRPFLHRRHDPRTRGAGAGLYHHFPGVLVETESRGRRRRDRRAIAPAAPAWKRRNAGHLSASRCRAEPSRKDSSGSQPRHDALTSRAFLMTACGLVLRPDGHDVFQIRHSLDAATTATGRPIVQGGLST